MIRVGFHRPISGFGLVLGPSTSLAITVSVAGGRAQTALMLRLIDAAVAVYGLRRAVMPLWWLEWLEPYPSGAALSIATGPL
jgi:hypothetical protein